MGTILIVDDDKGFREGLGETLRDLGYTVLEAEDAAAGLACLRHRVIDAVFLDLRMPEMDGQEALRRIRSDERFAQIPVIVLTAFASGANTIAAMRLGALDHLIKPVGRADIEGVLKRALARPSASRGPAAAASDDDVMLGASPALRQVHKLIGMAAASEATVLITGETGTGKELAARALHANSERRGDPFIAINCAAIPSELLESQLFGSVRGAFTGAFKDRLGAFQEANGGTLLLDEIGDMDLAIQAKILRVLEDGSVAPVGASREQPINVRVLAATHRDLHAAVQAGAFREDLFFRLNIIRIELPPLRERVMDIIPLAELFLRNTLGRGEAKILSPAAMERLTDYAWPGNVRELKNAMERLSVLVRGPMIEATDVAFLALGTADDSGLMSDLFDGELPAAMVAVEKLMITRALEACGGNRAAAARRLGIHRQLLYSKMHKYDLAPGQEQDGSAS